MSRGDRPRDPLGQRPVPTTCGVEASLRPHLLAEYVGQEKIVDNLQVFIQAARERREALDHVLLFGPPGLGKTTLAHIIAHEMGAPLRTDLGPGARARRRPRRHPHQPRAGRGAVHRRDPPPRADGRGDPLPGARGLPPRPGDRPGAGGAHRQDRAAALHAGRRHHPRRADHARRCAPASASSTASTSTSPQHLATIVRALGAAARDRDRRRGRDGDRAPQPRHAAHRQPPAAPGARLRAGGGRRRDRRRRRRGARSACSRSTSTASTRSTARSSARSSSSTAAARPGIQAIAAAVGEDRGTLEDLYEPFLIQEGFLQRTPRGRVATRRAYEHLGYPPPRGVNRPLF